MSRDLASAGPGRGDRGPDHERTREALGTRWQATAALVLGALAAAPGCSSAPPPAPPAPVASGATAPPPPAAVPVELRAALTFEAAGGRALKVPMVEVDIRGVRTRLIVDSGASHHVLTTAVAARVGLQPEATTVDGRDHAGSAVRGATLPDLAVRLADGDVDLRDVYSVDGPPPFEPLGIGGFLSPQKMFSSGYVVLDLPGRRLLQVSTDDEARTLGWMRATFGGGEILETRHDESGKPITRFRVDGHPPVTAEIDTGGSDTEVLAVAVAAPAGTGACSGIGVSGDCVESRALDGVTVQFAGRSFGPMTVRVVDAMKHGKGIDDEAGLLGMDVLAQCVLAFPQRRSSAVLAHCPPPTAARAAGPT